jgi:response regulator RpfG family c-di-GMP phosphodiesterase
MNPRTLTRKEIGKISVCIIDGYESIPAATFSNFPLSLKRHSVQVGAVAGLMAKYVPEQAIPSGMGRDEYANAVRYSGIYHEIGLCLLPNHYTEYPEAGERLLREQVTEWGHEAARNVLLESVRCSCERYNGSGYPDKLSGEQIPMHAQLVAIADEFDTIISHHHRPFSSIPAAEKFVDKNTGNLFSPAAVKCFEAAKMEIYALYKRWRKAPPCWLNSDIVPFSLPIEKPIG